MTFDYHVAKREMRDALSHIGQAITGPEAERLMSAEQVSRRRGVNFMTDERWQYRVIAAGSLVVEISYGWFLDHPLYGLTVFCVGDLAADAGSWDHSLSGAFGDIPSLAARVAELDSGGRERLAALAAQG